ncbi:unnamed protein product, partial [Meganyctiphanes norvegica]
MSSTSSTYTILTRNDSYFEYHGNKLKTIASSTDTTLTRNDSYCENHVTMEVKDLWFLRFQIIMPILVTMVVISHCFCLIVTRRANLRGKHFNQYYNAMSVVELVTATMYLPLFINSESCVFNNYALAFYNTYFGLTSINCNRTIGVYILVFLSYDRFLAVQPSLKFQQVRNSTIARTRLIIMVVFVVLCYIPVICLGEVIPLSYGRWVGVSVMLKKAKEGPWLKFLKFCFLMLCNFVPCVCLNVLSCGRTMGLAKRKAGNQGILYT